MTLLFPLLLPLLAVVIVLACSAPRVAVRAALSLGTLELLALANAVWRVHVSGALQMGRYLRADGLTAFFLINIGLIFGLVLVYSVGYLRHIPEGRFSSPRWFYALVFLFLFTMVAVYLSANLGMLWICVEATTLASGLLVGFYNTEGAVEAGWKYLIVCTVGIAFALFGTITLYLAAVRAGVPAESALDWTALMHASPLLGHRLHSLPAPPRGAGRLGHLATSFHVRRPRAAQPHLRPAERVSPDRHDRDRSDLSVAPRYAARHLGDPRLSSDLEFGVSLFV
jgi:hydrogenase-4 component F